YIWDFEEIDTIPAKTLRLHMKYGPNGERLISKIDRVSKPGCRKYLGYKGLKPILCGMGIQILTTPRPSSATSARATRQSAARRWRWWIESQARSRSLRIPNMPDSKS